MTDLGLALNRTYTDKNGEKREEVVFIDVTVWDRQAETCCQYLKKGRGIHVEGFLKMDTLGRQDDRREADQAQGPGRPGAVSRPSGRRWRRLARGRTMNSPLPRPRDAAPRRPTVPTLGARVTARRAASTSRRWRRSATTPYADPNDRRRGRRHPVLTD